MYLWDYLTSFVGQLCILAVSTNVRFKITYWNDTIGVNFGKIDEFNSTQIQCTVVDMKMNENYPTHFHPNLLCISLFFSNKLNSIDFKNKTYDLSAKSHSVIWNHSQKH